MRAAFRSHAYNAGRVSPRSVVLVGAYTLEGLKLAADPVTQRLLPVEVHPG